jgi:hypothetical protein
MNVMYPLATVDATAITTQVKMTLRYYHSTCLIPSAFFVVFPSSFK